MGQGSFTPVAADSCAVVGEVAAALAEGRPLRDALRVLARELDLRSVVVRSAAGEVLGVGGESLQAVTALRSEQDVWLEFPVPGLEGSTLTVRGGRPSQLPALRAVAAVIGLALSAHAVPDVSPVDVAADSELELDAIADAVHDGPLQSLMVARYAVDAAMRGADPAVMREAIQQAVVELRQLVWTLRPRGDAGLTAALQQLSTALVKADALPLELALEGPDPAGPTALLAYRLVQAVLSKGAPVRVRLSGTAIDIAGAPLPTPQRWVRRASALGCVLSTTGDQTRLVLATAPASSISNDVRTSS